MQSQKCRVKCQQFRERTRKCWKRRGALLGELGRMLSTMRGQRRRAAYRQPAANSAQFWRPWLEEKSNASGFIRRGHVLSRALYWTKKNLSHVNLLSSSFLSHFFVYTSSKMAKGTKRASPGAEEEKDSILESPEITPELYDTLTAAQKVAERAAILVGAELSGDTDHFLHPFQIATATRSCPQFSRSDGHSPSRSPTSGLSPS